jgi:uncharacterized integral membrane protein
MSDKKEKKESAAEKASKKRDSSSLAFSLVVIMLGILSFLIVLLLVFPSKDPTLLDYYKWTFTTLVGTFGAWIGAGSAYFFGRENLKESSASTERAMQIQQDSLRRPSGIEQIKDMALTAMNPNFFFDFEKNKNYVKEKLVTFKGYWFVPVGEVDTGILQDIIHAQVFWADEPFKDGTITLKDMVSQMDAHTDKSLRKLHGDSFYVKASPNDKISDVYNLICQKDAEVVIVVDEKGKASHCLSKTDLRTFLKVTDGK